MTICIFCLNKHNKDFFPPEHVFPYAIGGSFTINSVCKTCNNKLGEKIDPTLTEHWFVSSRRMIYKIKGHSGKVPNPLENAVMADNPDQKVKYIIENGKPKSVFNVTDVKKQINEDGSESIQITIDKSNAHLIPNILEKLSKRNQKDGSKLELKEIFRKDEKIEFPRLKLQAAISIFDFYKAIYKIAYEVSWYFIGNSYIQDTFANNIRKSLFDEIEGKEWVEKYHLAGNISFTQNTLNLPFTPSSHYAILIPVDTNKMGVYIKIFDVFESFLQVSQDEISYNPNLLKVIELDSLSRSHKIYNLWEFASYLNEKFDE